MITIFSKKESLIIEFLKEKKVATKRDICQHLEISPTTVIRAIEKYGYYSSYNKNAAYYTLKDIPNFNEQGLWIYKDIRFSQYKTLNETIVALINQSDTGYTTNEMQQLLGTEVKNVLSRLRRQKKLDKLYIGHQAVYLSINVQQQAKQKEFREQEKIKQRKQKQDRHFRQGILPEGIEVKLVIFVLVQMIIKPKSSIDLISESLQASGVKVSSEQIQKIISFYGLEKKMAR